jgi:hypothetical protein
MYMLGTSRDPHCTLSFLHNHNTRFHASFKGCMRNTWMGLEYRRNPAEYEGLLGNSSTNLDMLNLFL